MVRYNPSYWITSLKDDKIYSEDVFRLAQLFGCKQTPQFVSIVNRVISGKRAPEKSKYRIIGKKDIYCYQIIDGKICVFNFKGKMIADPIKDSKEARLMLEEEMYLQAKEKVRNVREHRVECKTSDDRSLIARWSILLNAIDYVGDGFTDEVCMKELSFNISNSSWDTLEYDAYLRCERVLLKPLSSSKVIKKVYNENHEAR